MLSFAVTVYNFNSGLVFVVILCTPYMRFCLLLLDLRRFGEAAN